ncbi:MAG: flavodoxin family protein [Oscillospiraceae bacterium]
MKVLLINGSPHEKGCTYTALREVADTLEHEGVETEILHIAAKPVGGCLGCGCCKRAGRCVQEDIVNEVLPKLSEADGFIFGSPVHFASASGAITSFMDRLFYAGGDRLRLKPAACVVSARRGGATAAFEQLNKYFTIREMPVVSSSYWNMVHGNTPEEVRQDAEGLQVMRVLGRNMAWLLRCRAAAEAAGVPPPERETPIATNFIR